MEEIFKELWKEFDDIVVAKDDSWIKCVCRRDNTLHPGDRFEWDKHCIGAVDKISKEHGLDYKYVSNLRLIRFDIFKDGSLFDLYE